MRFLLLFLIFCFSNFVYANDLDPKNYTEAAEIIILDKLEEGSKIVELRKNSIFSYKNIEVTLESCWMSPSDKDENMAKILVVEFPKNRKSEDISNRKEIFHGWIVSNNRKVSSLQHSVYQVHLLKCLAE